MKSNKYYYLAGFILIGLAVCASWQAKATAQTDGSNIQLSISTSEQVFTLGEVIELSFEIRNLADTPIEIQPPDVRTGNLKVYVSVDGMNFRKYDGPRWGSLRIGRQSTKLEAGESLRTAATMLHHKTVATDHLTKRYAERSRRENLDTDFVMMHSGRYWLKAVYSSGKAKLESEPFAIEVSEPNGLDAAVWEKIKTDAAYAYFLQTGEVVYRRNTEKRERFIESLRQISADFPDSVLAERIGNNLTKFDQNHDRVRLLQDERQH